jgi:hypothetical protein
MDRSGNKLINCTTVSVVGSVGNSFQNSNGMSSIVLQDVKWYKNTRFENVVINSISQSHDRILIVTYLTITL